MNCYGNNESLNALESTLQKIADRILEKDDRISVEEFVIRGIVSAMMRDNLDFAVDLLKSYRDLNTKSEA